MRSGSRALWLLLVGVVAPAAYGDPVSNEPLQQRLNAQTAELDRLKQDNDQLKQDVSRLQSELAAARTSHEPVTAQAPPPPAPIRETVFLRQPERHGQTSWTYLLGVSAVMLLVGFVVGWKTLDHRIRSKYGGLRIY